MQGFYAVVCMGLMSYTIGVYHLTCLILSSPESKLVVVVLLVRTLLESVIEYILPYFTTQGFVLSTLYLHFQSARE